MRLKKVSLWALLVVLSGVLLALLIGRAIQQAPEEAEKAYYRVTFYQGDEALTWKRLTEGSVVRLIPKQDSQGQPITRWLDENENFVEPDGIIVTQDMAFYAYEAPALHTSSHVPYMGDIVSLWFRPDVSLRREEAAQILYTLLEKPLLETAEIDSADETETLETLSTAVYDDLPLTDYQPVFSDVDQTSSYYTAIQAVTSYHLMQGYPDGTFRPNAAMTRAEFVSMLAKYGQPVTSDGTDFADVPADYWAADAIATAAASGWLEGFTDGKFYPDAPITRAQAVVILNRLLGYGVDSRAVSAAVPTGLYVDVAEDYWAYYDILDATYSSELLRYLHGEVEAEPGFVTIDGGLYHVNETGQLDYYQAGFQEIDGQLRYCSADGYRIDQFSTGLLKNLNGSMYYILSDGSFARNYYYGYLYFGSDGRYTSGSEYLDGMVEDFLSDILYDDSMSSYDKLYAAYNLVKSSFSYINWGDGYEAGTTGWAKPCAEVMFAERRGHCYYWAAAYMYLARRLGYQAYCVAGIAGTLGSWHAWVMIDWSDGSEYVFDPELEWSYEKGYIDGYVQHRDLFMQPFYSTGTLYTFADGSHTTQRSR